MPWAVLTLLLTMFSIAVKEVVCKENMLIWLIDLKVAESRI